MSLREKPEEKVWSDFQQEMAVTDDQLKKFQRYAEFLMQTNEVMNLTAVTNLSGVVRQHFQDSLSLSKFLTLNDITSIADVGTGAGFPAIPLKIMFPHLKVVLIEVTHKKQKFLEDLISILELTDIQICGNDWRTFLRTTSYQIDLFVTRAALDEVELMRMFKPACTYNTSKLVYWVSNEWEMDKKAAPLLQRLETYKLGQKIRKLAFFGLTSF